LPAESYAEKRTQDFPAGYKTMVNHLHLGMTSRLKASGSVDGDMRDNGLAIVDGVSRAYLGAVTAGPVHDEQIALHSRGETAHGLVLLHVAGQRRTRCCRTLLGEHARADRDQSRNNRDDGM
jgi:hypothetical protein